MDPTLIGGFRSTLPATPVVTGTQTIAPQGQCSRVDVNVTGQVTGTTDTGGGLDRIRISLFDDGAERDFEIVTVPVGQTTAFNVNLGFEGLFGTGAPGVGVVIWNGAAATGTTLFVADPFFPTDVAGSCGPPPPPPPVFIPVNSAQGLGLLILCFSLLGAFLLRAGRH